MKAPRSLKEFLEDGRPGVVGDFLFLHHVNDNSPVLARISLIECVFKYEGRTRIEFGRYENDYILVKDSLEDVLSAISVVPDSYDWYSDCDNCKHSLDRDMGDYERD